MSTISLSRLQLALNHLSLAEHDLVASCPAVEKLLERQRRLDRLQPLADEAQSSTNNQVWFAGVDHLRRRLSAYGALQARQVDDFLRTRATSELGNAVRLVVLFSAIEPGIAADVVLDVALNLSTGTKL